MKDFTILLIKNRVNSDGTLCNTSVSQGNLKVNNTENVENMKFCDFGIEAILMWIKEFLGLDFDNIKGMDCLRRSLNSLGFGMSRSQYSRSRKQYILTIYKLI